MLTDPKCKNASCPETAKRLRLVDGGGLYLEVGANGSKRWFWKYRIGGLEKRMALGSYPAVSLKAAREARDTAKKLKGEGRDPVLDRQVAKLRAVNPEGDTFQSVALEWHKRQLAKWSVGHGERTLRQMERDLFPWLGKRFIADIAPTEILATLRKIEDRGAIETADRALMICRQVWRYSVATGRADRDITADLKGALTPYQGKHHAAITDPAQLGVLLRAIAAYKGSPAVRAALQLAPILFQRPGELRGAAWAEIDLAKALWTIPPLRMKRGLEGKENGDPHLVPLPAQAIAILRELHTITGHGAMVFPGERSHERPISDNSVRTALISMGYTPEIQTWHGFRATARTMLAERLECDTNVIEAQLAHAVKDANGRAYNRTQYMEQRRRMMQQWADYLDKLRMGADVIVGQFGKAA